MSDILKVQRSFARKATAHREHRFEDLYHLLTREEWLKQALKHVLGNKGANTPGIDGISKKDLKTETQQNDFIRALHADLKTGNYKPMPVRRAWIPKPGKEEKRGLGIPSLRDRVVQEMLRMLMEPIWESDFLDCSNGFRPQRRTMDCIALFYARVHTVNKYFWAIEGDIRKCFDRINHAILLKLIRQRIADQHIIDLIDAFLTAGVMDNALFQDTPEGTPQGGILSPLLANIYLHQLDLWWWRKFGSLTRLEKSKRRKQHHGNAILTRYADDFVILWSGTHAEAKALKAELKQFLWDELHLELSEEKTHITHLTDGLDFLGFHIQWMLPKDGHKPWLRVSPTKENLARFRAKLKAQTKRGTTLVSPEAKFKSLNHVIFGWGNYYRHVSFSHDARELDFWINRRVLIWLYNKHQRRSVGWLLNQYKIRQTSEKRNRWNFAAKDAMGNTIFIKKLSDIHLTSYLHKKLMNPYLDAEDILIIDDTDTPFFKPRVGNIGLKGLAWVERRREALARDGGRCVRCGTNTQLLEVHHIISRREGGTDELDNLITLCAACHAKTPTYGRPKRDEKISRKAG